MRKKVTGKILTLYRTLESALPALLALLDVPVDEPTGRLSIPPSVGSAPSMPSSTRSDADEDQGRGGEESEDLACHIVRECRRASRTGVAV